MDLPVVPHHPPLDLSNTFARRCNSVYQGLQAVESVTPSYVRFFNNTRRLVDIFWVEFLGRHARYAALNPHGWFDIDTFVTHPWIFRDSHSGEPLITLPKREYVFRPEPPRSQQVTRRVVVIGNPVVTLQDRCLQYLRPHFEHQEDAIASLPIPKVLANLLQESVQAAVNYRRNRVSVLEISPPNPPAP